ncbi:MAG: hypothetical protein J6S67_20460 [Methanobrevibacter sp.]|nr:hypothetical protein [Methanobrevibacter sp.]
MYQRSRRIDFVCPPPGYYRLSPVEVEKDGSLVRTSEFKFFNPSEEFGHLASTDFGIMNLMAVGAYEQMRPVTLSKNSDMSFADQFATLTSTENV